MFQERYFIFESMQRNAYKWANMYLGHNKVIVPVYLILYIPSLYSLIWFTSFYFSLKLSDSLISPFLILFSIAIMCFVSIHPVVHYPSHQPCIIADLSAEFSE